MFPPKQSFCGAFRDPTGLGPSCWRAPTGLVARALSDFSFLQDGEDALAADDAGAVFGCARGEHHAREARLGINGDGLAGEAAVENRSGAPAVRARFRPHVPAPAAAAGRVGEGGREEEVVHLLLERLAPEDVGDELQHVGGGGEHAGVALRLLVALAEAVLAGADEIGVPHDLHGAGEVGAGDGPPARVRHAEGIEDARLADGVQALALETFQDESDHDEVVAGVAEPLSALPGGTLLHEVLHVGLLLAEVGALVVEAAGVRGEVAHGDVAFRPEHVFGQVLREGGVGVELAVRHELRGGRGDDGLGDAHDVEERVRRHRLLALGRVEARAHRDGLGVFSGAEHAAADQVVVELELYLGTCARNRVGHCDSACTQHDGKLGRHDRSCQSSDKIVSRHVFSFVMRRL